MALQANKNLIQNVNPRDVVCIMDPAHPDYDVDRKLNVKKSDLESARTLGILQPAEGVILPDGKIRIVYGNHRTMWARILTDENEAKHAPPFLLPIKIGDYTRAEAALVDMTENAHRRTVNVMEAARKAQRAIEPEDGSKGTDIAVVAVALRIDVATLRRWLLFPKSAPELQDALEGDLIGLNAALEIARMPLEKQAAAVEKALKLAEAAGATGKDAKKITDRSAKESAAENKGKEASDKPSSKERREMKASLDAALGEKQSEGHRMAVEVFNWFENKRLGENLRAARKIGREVMEAKAKAELEVKRAKEKAVEDAKKAAKAEKADK